MGDIVRGLLELQAQEGWLPPEGLEALASRLRVPLHRIESVSTFYPHFHRSPPKPVCVRVCRDVACRLSGSGDATAALRAWAAGRDDVSIAGTSCLGRCDVAPAAAIDDATVDARDLVSIEGLAASDRREPGTRAVGTWPDADPYVSEPGSSGGARVPADARPGPDQPYATLRRVLAGSRQAPIEALERAGLRGMGGAGFPTARKWSFVAAEPASVKHVICNADESEPGTFKDRELIHDLPHLVVEGMAIAAYCVGARRGTVFIRHEYEPERRRLAAEIERARALGALGDGVFGSDFAFDVDVFVSPGGYILGEETALLECLEDRRGEPRNKPPFPGRAGLQGRPTVVNNVETLVHAVGIVAYGPEWWQALGREGFAGHKFMSVCGDVTRPGVSLVPSGTTFAELLERHGGMKDGAALLTFSPGGASSHFLGPEAIGVGIDFDAVAAAGSMLGSGAALFVAEGRDLLDVGLSLTRFFRNESCGKCVPCRLGTAKAVEQVEKSGRVEAEDEAWLRSLDETLQQTSLCGLGQVALGPLLSLVSRFPERVGRSGGD